MKNIKDYNLDELKKELENLGESHLEIRKYSNGYFKKKLKFLMK